MKQILLLLLLSILGFLPMHSQKSINTSTGEISSNLSPATATRIVTEKADGFIVTYNIPEANITPDAIFQDCDVWTIRGFLNNNTSGEPTKSYTRYEAALLTIFGDPSLDLRIHNPKIPAISINTNPINGNKSIITEDDVLITFYDSNHNYSYTYKGSVEMTREQYREMSKMTALAHGPGYKPTSVFLTPTLFSSPQHDNSMVREDRYWTYHSDFNDSMEPSTDINLTVGFRGSMEVDGKDYSKCLVWRGGTEMDENTGTLLCLMREEDGRIYARYDNMAAVRESESGIDFLMTGPTMINFDDPDETTEDEHLIFDFNIKEGETLFSNPEAFGERGFKVMNVVDTKYDGKPIKKWELDKYSYYENVGDEIGLLPFPDSWPICYCCREYRLTGVYDAANNLLFDPLKIAASTKATEREEFNVAVQNNVLSVKGCRSEYIELYNTSGALIWKAKTPKGTASTSTDAFLPGVYVVRNGTDSAKIVIH